MQKQKYSSMLVRLLQDSKKHKCIVQKKCKDWDTLVEVLSKRYNVPKTNTNLIMRYMSVEMGLADESMLQKRGKVGHPNKWYISNKGLILYARYNLERMLNPKTKKEALMINIKQQYSYTESIKTLMNVCKLLERDPFVINVFDTLNFNYLSNEKKREILERYSNK